MHIFPDPEWFDGFSRTLEAHPDFKENGRWFDGTLSFRCDSVAASLVFERGIISRTYAGMTGYDILINATRQQWEDYLNSDLTLVRVHRNALMEIRGDSVRVMQNWKALFFITQILKFEIRASRETLQK